MEYFRNALSLIGGSSGGDDFVGRSVTVKDLQLRVRQVVAEGWSAVTQRPERGDNGARARGTGHGGAGCSCVRAPTGARRAPGSYRAWRCGRTAG